jgi:hypothetical protein
MSREQLRARDRWIFWSVVAMCLVPLIPYAIHGAGG